MTVKESVIRVIIKHYPKVKNHLVMTANPKHSLSGLQRIRELRQEGKIDYEFDRKTNTYEILTPKIKLERLLEVI